MMIGIVLASSWAISSFMCANKRVPPTTAVAVTMISGAVRACAAVARSSMMTVIQNMTMNGVVMR